MNGFLIGLLVSQGLFAKAYGGTGTEAAECVIQTSDGGFALTGTTESFGTDSGDILVIKLNSSGEVTWAKTYAIPAARPGNEEAVAIVQTPDGGYAVAGYKKDAGEANVDFLVLKLDASGSLTWVRGP